MCYKHVICIPYSYGFLILLFYDNTCNYNFVHYNKSTHTSYHFWSFNLTVTYAWPQFVALLYTFLSIFCPTCFYSFSFVLKIVFDKFYLIVNISKHITFLPIHEHGIILLWKSMSILLSSDQPGRFFRMVFRCIMSLVYFDSSYVEATGGLLKMLFRSLGVMVVYNRTT